LSKNVAVFVDVANIFYAAKAAGIDIDYVTLLKSATAGRDFVRAYAYTGLDPENENQRQFHSFLARNGYKVISKDIRKYGDGRIKANLDIELVVDLMKTARNLDIAVVVSGDGDFAPAIRAVQEQGVRVEVISFRGNTSSDLIDVADQFTDIAQIARVEKGSARSGRRVASEGDLSMTEVPEKETEGAPRRRRGRRDERIEEAAAASGAAPGGRRGDLIVLPGERLSRAPEGEEEGELAEAELGDMAEMAEGEAVGEYAGSDNGRAAAAEDGRRRRRRRGGRGRGRGRQEGEGFVEGVGVAAGADEEDEEFEDVAPAPPPHQTFGSVWDSQIGVPSSSTTATPSGFLGDASDAEEEDLEEPEVPEYLLAERRQRGRQGGASRGGRMGRGRSAYQAALDRERYGNRAPQPSFGGGGSGAGSRQDRARGRDRGRGGRSQQGGRPIDRGPRVSDRPLVSQPRSAEPWSEVPPEIEELLRAELARKGPEPGHQPAAPVEEPELTQPFFSATPEESAPVALVEEAAAEAPVKRTRRTRATKSAATEASTGDVIEAADALPAEEKPKRRTTRSRTSASASKPAEEPAATAEPKKRTTTRRRTTAKAAPEES
jgi:uncharacterized LabA/DUF88 family protein